MTLTPHVRHQGWVACLGAQSFASPFQMRGWCDSEGASATSAHHSIVAGVRPAVWRVIRATKAVVVKAAANEMTSSIAKVISVHARHVTSAETGHATSAEATHVTPAEAADVTSAKAADVASAKAAHMASATTSMSSATSAATAGLCIRGKQAAGKHCAC